VGNGFAAIGAVILLSAAACATAPRKPAEAADPRLTSLLVEAIRFPTVAGNDQARKDQQTWLLRTAASLGLVARDAGPVTEIELPGPPGAPVLGLVVHGDVQPVDEKGAHVGKSFLAVDRAVQAGEGDTVLVLREGTGIRQLFGVPLTSKLPIRSCVVGVVDGLDFPVAG